VAAYPSPAEMEEVTLLDVLDTALDKGVVLQGDATISVADVDLVFLGLKLVLASVDTMESWRRSTGLGTQAGSTGQCGPAQYTPRGALSPACRPAGGVVSGCEAERPIPAWNGYGSAGEPEACRESRKPWADADRVEQGLAKLVLTVVELLRQLLERQALRRMERGSLTDHEVEQMGLTFQRLEQKMEELRGVFGLAGEELNLNLGPLGNLM